MEQQSSQFPTDRGCEAPAYFQQKCNFRLLHLFQKGKVMWVWAACEVELNPRWKFMRISGFYLPQPMDGLDPAFLAMWTLHVTKISAPPTSTFAICQCARVFFRHSTFSFLVLWSYFTRFWGAELKFVSISQSYFCGLCTQYVPPKNSIYPPIIIEFTFYFLGKLD